MKKILKITIPIIVLVALCYLGYGVVSKMQEKKIIAEKLQTVPEFQFQTLDDSTFNNVNLQPNKITIFIYFNSTCDFCQHEAQSISENINELNDVQFLFVSTEEKTTIKQFSETYNLNNQLNITFLYDTTNTFTNRFGANSIPYLLIYDANGNLLKRHNGQLNANSILRILNN